MIRNLVLAVVFLFAVSHVNAFNIDRDLLRAIENGELARVVDLLDKGADIDKPDIYGFTPLIWATTAGNMEILNVLIDRGADINFTNEDGGTALYYAVTNGKVDELNILLQHGANPNVRFMDGETALDYARVRDWGEFPEIVTILEAAGAKD